MPRRILIIGASVADNIGCFYGGWTTSELGGPFQGRPGSTGW
jgi:hypothetical protein